VQASRCRKRVSWGNLWVTLGAELSDPVLAGKINDLCELLTGQHPTLTDPALAWHRLGELLDDREPTLLVVDDVWGGTSPRAVADWRTIRYPGW
jgi:hypothetical protein